MARKFSKVIESIFLLGFILLGVFFFLLQDVKEHFNAQLAALCQTTEVAPATNASPASLSPGDANTVSPLHLEVSQIKKALLPKWLVTYQLTQSSLGGTAEEMKEVIAAGADVNSFNRLDVLCSQPPLHYAILSQKDTLGKNKIFLANGADPNAFNELEPSDRTA